MISGMSAYTQAEDYGLRPEEAGRNSLALRGSQKELAPGDPGAAVKQDTVTLSVHVQSARLRESLGLDPSGNTSLEEVRDVVAHDREIVISHVERAVSGMNMGKGRKISLSLSDVGKVKVTGLFMGGRKIEDALNGDDGFLKTFGRLDTNSRMIKYVSDSESKPESSLSFPISSAESVRLNRFLSTYVGSASYGQQDPLRDILESSSGEAYRYSLEYTAA